jgi:hypothetical protein
VWVATHDGLTGGRTDDSMPEPRSTAKPEGCRTIWSSLCTRIIVAASGRSRLADWPTSRTAGSLPELRYRAERSIP